MALAYGRVQQTATEARSLARELLLVVSRMNRFLEYNSDQAIDWGAQGATPEYIDEDENGNLSGFQFTRQAMSNAIGSMAQLRNLLTNQSVVEGDHLGTLNTISDP